MKSALELLPRMGKITVPNFPSDTGLLTETTSSIEVGKRSEQTHLQEGWGNGGY